MRFGFFYLEAGYGGRLCTVVNINIGEITPKLALDTHGGMEIGLCTISVPV